jgi:hypothetical protein
MSGLPARIVDGHHGRWPAEAGRGSVLGGFRTLVSLVSRVGLTGLIGLVGLIGLLGRRRRSD